MISGVYCIENKINGKKYIGQSNNIRSRWYNHKWCLNNFKHSNSYLQNAWNKYGEENFNFYILEECEKASIDDVEKYYINLYNSTIDNNGYNLDSGGNLNKQQSNETKLKISKGNKGKILSNETRLKISLNRKNKMTGNSHFMFGKHMSEETKKKLSNSLKGLITYDKHYEARSVICLTTNKVFTTIKSAGEFYNISRFNISRCCRGKGKSAGKLDDGTPMQWAYYYENEKLILREYKKDTNAKSINQYDLKGNFIATFKSAREAEKETGIGYKMISRVCTGERKQTHGFIWKFNS